MEELAGSASPFDMDCASQEEGLQQCELRDRRVPDLKNSLTLLLKSLRSHTVTQLITSTT